ncbi:3386_t:CDS:1 [Acaulospora colombiana]|uniref:3386_t:CDS:1 n=1 Tax=Acaulospora colombiana TaxID=27376 RepID=A0ACA9L7R2_9GLOM|nr:3386_t:CDS:1 [Acaulospora colombiana]
MILDRALKGEVREWYHGEFDNKNWMLDNVLDNSAIGATIAHIRGANAGAITGANASFPNIQGGLAGADIIPARNISEDSTIAGGHPTNVAVNAPNANAGNSIVLAGIRLGQRLDHMKKHFPTANKYVKMLEIGALKQGIYESVPSFWAKIKKYGDQLGFTPAQKKTQFLSGVRKDIRDEIYRIGQTKPINDIIDSLAELELHRGVLEQPPSPLSYTPAPPTISNNVPQQQGISLADIQKYFKMHRYSKKLKTRH